jgi:hypothetical protein
MSCVYVDWLLAGSGWHSIPIRAILPIRIRVVRVGLPVNTVTLLNTRVIRRLSEFCVQHWSVMWRPNTPFSSCASNTRTRTYISKARNLEFAKCSGVAEPRKKTRLHFHCKFLDLRLSNSEVSLVSQASFSELLLLYVLVRWFEDSKEI